VSLGDTDTLVQHPISMMHATYALEEREYHGFADGLIRISVGLQDYEDLRADFISALDQIRESKAYFRRPVVERTKPSTR
jgi:cystathionine beta-lyase/cystathionine gamma-synthase